MKKHLLQLFLLLVALILPATAAAANYFTVDGINYVYDTYWDQQGEVYVGYNNNFTEDIVVIPDSVEYQSKKYPVAYVSYDAFSGTPIKSVILPSAMRTIKSGAFSRCTALTSISLPNSLKDLDRNAFYGCTALTSISLPDSLKYLGYATFYGCTALKSISLPNSLKSLEYATFYGCTNLTSITLPDSLTTIRDAVNQKGNGYEIVHNGVFELCESLTSITIPAKVKHIGDKAFIGCSKLTSVSLGESVESIGNETFKSCSELNDIKFPASLKSIGDEAFSGTNLTEIVFPESVTEWGKWVFKDCGNLKKVFLGANVTNVGDSPFWGCKDLSVTIKGKLTVADLSRLTGGTLENSTILTNIHNVEFEPGGNFVLSNHLPEDRHIECRLYDLSILIKDYQEYFKGFQFKLEPNPYWDETETTKATLSAAAGWQLPTPREDGVYFVEGLDFESSRDLNLAWNKKIEPAETESVKITFKTGRPRISVGAPIQTTQATVRIESMAFQQDITFRPDGPVSFSYNKWDSENKRFIRVDQEYEGKPLTLGVFPPDYMVEISPYTTYNYKRHYAVTIKVKTKPLNPIAKIVDVGPTSVEVEGSYNEGDAEISWMGFTATDKAKTFKGKNTTVTGYTPETEGKISFKMISCDKEYVSPAVEFTTTALELNTLAPKCVSSSCAIVAAETNISDFETTAGFQWKKYDAPASLSPSEAYAAIYDGMLEGYIKNLQSTSYYNVRPFFKDAKGKYYYGEWVTFDPSDFSYFEPTVHTYPVEEVAHTSATMRGYVLGGTDEITEQGFQYWEEGAIESERKNAPAKGVMSVEGFGQVMRVVVDGLKECTTYAFRSYAKAGARTTYGEEFSFTTAGTAGIDDISVDATPVPVGYFDLCGRRYDEPRPGLNIVVYSDGTSRKFIYR